MRRVSFCVCLFWRRMAARQVEARRGSLRTREQTQNGRDHAVLDCADVVWCDDNVINSKVLTRMLAELGVQGKTFIDALLVCSI